jgi:metallo-beta-lactamase family protein
MKLTFLGAAQTVTGSMHLLEVNGHRLLLDCGLYQGHRREAFERNRGFPFDPDTIDALILSHAHIDHSGNIPSLVRHGFRGEIFTTSATRDLCGTMLLDSAHIQEKDAEYLNKRHKHGTKVEPLYTMRDAVASLAFFHGVSYHRPFTPIPGVTAEFLDAGHILGSAITIMDINEEGRETRLVFTGDLGRDGLAVIRDPERVYKADYLISESTYGGRSRHPADDIEQELQDVVTHTARKGGKVIIPAFSVGRTQEIVYNLHQLADAGRIPEIPIFVDSPLSTNVTEVFRHHADCYDEETCKLLQDSGDPFGFGLLHYTRDVDESKRLNNTNVPCVIISASGMCETGRILHHLKNAITEPKNTILIVSFQAEGTLGQRLVERQQQVSIFGHQYTRRAEVAVINGFSAHADKDELLAWMANFDDDLKRVFLVHGNLDQAEMLAGGIKEQREVPVTIPARGDSVSL